MTAYLKLLSGFSSDEKGNRKSNELPLKSYKYHVCK